jgi:hypothetical protein
MRMRTTRVWLTFLGIGLCAGCAARSAGSSACAPVRAEFSLFGQTVYRDCEVDRRARLQTPLPEVPYTLRRGESCVRATIDFVVDAAGHPVLSTARVARGSDPTFAEAVLGTLEALRYEPALKEGRAVPQLVRLGRSFAVRGNVVLGGAPSAVRPPRRAPC